MLVGKSTAFRQAQPAHVSLSYDEDLMKRFVPLVDDPPRRSADEEPQQWYGWIATSNEYDYDVYVYVLKYRTQRGATALDSHRYDREPVIVYVDPEFNEVREVTYTAYHWYAANDDAPPTSVSGDRENPTFAIIAPWNHYMLLEDAEREQLDDLPVSPLGTDDGHPFSEAGEGQTAFESWLDTGWREALHPPALLDPAVMRTREKFWADGRETLGARIWRNLQLTMARTGFENPRLVGGAPESDLT